MLSATFTGMVTTHYEEAFVSLPLLVSFMPMLMDTAGNCGNQISTLMVRGLALGEVEPADFLKVLAKELRVSAIVGAVLGGRSSFCRCRWVPGRTAGYRPSALPCPQHRRDRPPRQGRAVRDGKLETEIAGPQGSGSGLPPSPAAAVPREDTAAAGR